MSGLQPSSQQERERRWRLILGRTEEEQENNQSTVLEPLPGEGEMAEGEGQGDAEGSSLSEEDQAIDDALEQLYGEGVQGGDADSSPDIARWLGDINKYFPSSVVQVIQEDAVEKWKLRKLIKEADFIEAIEPNVALTAKLIALSKLMPEDSKEAAKRVVQKLVDELKEKLEYPLLQAIQGSLNRSVRTRSPSKQKEINWFSTIHANLKHYLPK